MAALDWYVSLLGAVAWPLSTLVIALLFRQDVKRALGRIGQFRYRDLEINFRAELHQAETLARSIPAPPPKDPVLLEIDPGETKPFGGPFVGNPSVSVVGSEDRERLVNLAKSSPREAVAGAWDVAAQALVRTAQALADRKMSGLLNADSALKFLVDRGWLTGPEAMLVGLLRTLKDRAGHQQETAPTADEARRYVGLVLDLATKIEARG